MGDSLTMLSKRVAAANRLYLNLMAEVEAASTDAAEAVRRYWWNLWLIKRDKLWRAGGFKTESAWIASWQTEPWAQSRATFFGVMQAIERWYALGGKDEDVQQLLGQRKTAIEADLGQWFTGTRDNEALKPEVRMMLAAKHETPIGALLRIAALGATEARVATGEVVDREYFFVPPDSLAWDNDHTLHLRLRHEHTRKGIMGEYTVKLIFTPIVEGRKSPGYLRQAAEWLLSKFGLNV